MYCSYTYQDGLGLTLGLIGATLLYSPIAAHLLIPYYHTLQLNTPYEYFELRFCRGMRTGAAVSALLIP